PPRPGRPALGGDLEHGPALAGLPSLPDLRPGGGGVGAGDAQPHPPDRGAGRRPGPGRRADQLSDDRLPERLRQALPGRRRLRRHHARQVRRLPGRRLRRHPAERALRPQRALKGDPGAPARAARRLCRGANPGRRLRGLVPPLRRRHPPRALPGAGCMSAIQALPSLEGASAEEILRWTYANHRRVAIVASFQAESSVLIHLAAQVVERPEVVTLDTGRLPEETHQVMDAFRSRYPIRLHVQAPDPAEVAEMVGEHGPNLFYDSVELRRHCCEVRKSRPLVRALAGYDAWVTGGR